MNSAKTEAEKSKNIWEHFYLQIGLVITLFIVGIFVFILIRNNDLLLEEIKTRASTHFESIVYIRRWVAEYGGVYVEKKEGVETNPYLEDPDFEAADGTVYTLRNPALVTREISETAVKNDQFSFHITSLLPLNPGNSPDEFESYALRLFESGEKEYFTKEKDENRTYFRYMGPLITEESCLTCHAKQGYKVGDIRGGISVSLDITDIEDSIKTNNYLMIFLSLLTTGLILSLVYLPVKRLKGKLQKAEDEKNRLIGDLQKSLEEIKTLQGFIPICSACKNIRDDEGYWEQIETYISKRSEAAFTHSICPECMDKLYPDIGKV